ncbi:hypothetical protein KIL84_002515 [Mauremys mutica]|uniref:Uncharacterized protein n=1 Tax=Mauremys mutica TaxID=74926 RepID=A0A9D3X7K3_9SAUR|nr:hypothetical protein KIL84_002515 [Mauremys mutica]
MDCPTQKEPRVRAAQVATALRTGAGSSSQAAGGSCSLDGTFGGHRSPHRSAPAQPSPAPSLRQCHAGSVTSSPTRLPMHHAPAGRAALPPSDQYTPVLPAVPDGTQQLPGFLPLLYSPPQG